MKKYNPSIGFPVAMLFAMTCIVACFSCKGGKKNGGEGQLVSKDSLIIVMRNTGVSYEDFLAYLNRHHAGTVQYLCNSCDSSILLVSRAVVGGSGQAATGGSLPGDGPTGGQSLGYWCNNFEIRLEIPKDRPNGTYKTEPTSVDYSSTDTVVVAVLDTGVDSGFLAQQNLLFRSHQTSCIGSDASIAEAANNGWNFVNSNANVDDDFLPPHGHGSNVAQFIVEQARLLRKSPVKILPVKVLDDKGKGNLFDLMCGMAYAVERGAKIVNVSLGYYVCDQLKDATTVFRQFTKNHLLDKQVLLLAAAGNVESDPNCAGVRDLKQTHFYPGSFSEEDTMKNVITVTTIGKKDVQVSNMQNFSDAVVDIGVVADEASPGGFEFENPRLVGQHVYIAGSSYATPIAAGAIAACFSEAMPGGPVDKDAIINFLVNHGKVVLDPQFEQRQEVKKGRKLYRDKKLEN